MTTNSGHERRQYWRIVPNHEQPVRVDINGANFIDILHAIDISEGGLGVRVGHGFNGCDLDDRVSFVIEIPAPKHALLHCSGRIKHISGNHFGVVFDPLPMRASSCIREYIALNLKKESWWIWLQYKLRLIH